jgi:hypothetical protein
LAVFAGLLLLALGLSHNVAASMDTDNDLQHATEIFNNEPAYGNIDPSDDAIDYYKIYLDAGESLDVSLSMGSSMDIDLFVYDATDLLAYSAQDNIALNNYTEHISLTSVAPGWYYIEVTSTAGSGQYELLVRTMANWTILVYLDADNNLEDMGLEDFLEMAAVGSNPELNILVQMDRSDGTFNNGTSWGYYPSIDAVSYDNWTDAKRFRVTEGMAPTSSNALQDLGEVDMGSPDTLYQFLSWGRANYPAHHYLVVLWDHGGNWRGVCWDDQQYPATYLSMDDLHTAFSACQGDDPDLRFDIIGFDACVMAGIEVYAEIAPYCDYLIGSEINEPGPGWNYQTALQYLIADPAASPLALAQGVVDSYIAAYQTPLLSYERTDVTLSVFDAARINAIVSAFNALTDSLSDQLYPLHNYYSHSRYISEAYGSGNYVDLLDLLYNIYQNVPDPSIQAQCHDLIVQLESAIVVSETIDVEGDEVLAKVSGLSLYFPGKNTSYDPRYGTETLSFTQSTQWDRFLEALRAYEAVPNDPVVISTSSPSNEQTIVAGAVMNFSISVGNSDGDALLYLWYIDGVYQAGLFTDGISISDQIDIGTHNITVVVFDGADRVQHSWTLRVQSPPNLSLIDQYLTDPQGNHITEVTSGQPFYAYLRVGNLGQYGTSSFIVTYYLDSIELCHWDVPGINGGASQLLVTTLFISDCGPHTLTFVIDPASAIAESNESDNGGGCQFNIVRAAWTVLVYLDGDNNLEGFLIDNFLELAAVGSDQQVNIVVQMDRINYYENSYGNWADCRRYLVYQGDEPTAAGALMALGEVNMGDDATLSSFLLWGADRFQAERYMVILKDHGASWMGCCYDDTSYDDRLELGELQTSIAALDAQIGHPVDIIVFDNCLMGSIEVATQLDGLAHYAVVSETVRWTNNLNYTSILAAIDQEPTITARDLATFICATQELVDDPEYVTQSVAVYDLSKVAQLKAAFDLYCTELARCFNTTSASVHYARLVSDYIVFLSSGPGDEVIDLYQFVENSMTYCDDASLSVRAQALLDLLTPGGNADSIMVFSSNTESASFCHGMSIYFPSDAEQYMPEYLTSGWFGSSSAWNYFLPRYVLEEPPSTTIAVEGTEGGNGWYRSCVNITFSVTDPSGEGVSWVRYSLDGGEWTDDTGEFRIDLPGPHVLRFRTLGNNGVCEEINTFEFKIDRAVPTIRAGEVGGLLELTASDATSGVASVHYRIDGGTWLTYSAPVAIGPLGWAYTVDYYAVDNAGNPSGCGEITIGSDDDRAPVTTASPSGTTDDEGRYIGSASLTLTASDTGSGVKHINYRRDGGSWQVYGGTITFDDEGTYVVAYCSEDRFGNREAQWTMTMTVVPATTPGTVTALNFREVNGDIVVTWECADNGGVNLTGFLVYRSVDGNELQLVGTVDGSQYIDADVEPGHTYQYAVAAVNQLGSGPASMALEAELPRTSGSPLTLALLVIAVAGVVSVLIVMVRRKR